MSSRIGESVLLSLISCHFLLKKWRLLGAIISCSIHPCENHSGQLLAYLSSSCATGKDELRMLWRYA